MTSVANQPRARQTNNIHEINSSLVFRKTKLRQRRKKSLLIFVSRMYEWETCKLFPPPPSRSGRRKISPTQYFWNVKGLGGAKRCKSRPGRKVWIINFASARSFHLSQWTLSCFREQTRSSDEDVKDSPTISTIINIMQRMLAIINFLLKVLQAGKRRKENNKDTKYDHIMQWHRRVGQVGYVPCLLINPIRSLTQTVAMSWKLYKKWTSFYADKCSVCSASLFVCVLVYREFIIAKP